MKRAGPDIVTIQEAGMHKEKEDEIRRIAWYAAYNLTRLIPCRKEVGDVPPWSHNYISISTIEKHAFFKNFLRNPVAQRENQEYD